MTDTRCWIGYSNDDALKKKVEDGWFTEGGVRHVPIDDFPPRPANSVLWPALLSSWALANAVKCDQVDPLTVCALVSKNQIAAFIDHVYDDPGYTDPASMLTWSGRAIHVNHLTDLRAFVAQHLDDSLLYQLYADEF